MTYTVFNLNTAVAGGQGYQPGGRFLPDLRRRGHFAKKSSMANLSGLEDKKGFVFSTLDNSASSRSMVFSCLCRMISQSGEILSPSCSDAFSVIVLPCKAMRRSTSHHGADSDYSDSLALRRWRRLISPFAAVTKKPAVLSPGSLSCSISSITSCGILTVVICDFAFFAPVAISGSPKNWCMSVYAKKNDKKSLKCISPVSKLKSRGEIHLKEQRPAVLATHAGRLTNNVN
ncbi:hypothetical protein LLY61_003646 [Escherichia coli]|nr:hypothetical protein [Escherichia coli]